MGVHSTINWDVARKAMLRAGHEILEVAAEYMVMAAQSYCPVDTGFLSASIGSEDLFDSYRVFASAPYAQWVEFGHVSRSGTWVSPNPFFRLALADTVRAFPQIAGSVRIAG